MSDQLVQCPWRFVELDAPEDDGMEREFLGVLVRPPRLLIMDAFPCSRVASHKGCHI